MQQPHDGRNAGRASTARLLLFASGDFACNLYWQSSVFYLMFFYTDVLRLSPAMAGLIAMTGSLWDGIADLAVGLFAQRNRLDLWRLMAGGAVPLGASFVALYLSGDGSPVSKALLALGAQLLFRSFYALVNVSYSAVSVQISPHSDDRALIAGARMVFGTAAALVVAMMTQYFTQTPMGRPTGATGFLTTAALFAAIGTGIIWCVARAGARPSEPDTHQDQASIAQCLGALVRNKAFMMLNAAAVTTGIAGALLIRSVLYYFGDVAKTAAAGSATLAAMGLVGAFVVPLWMLFSRRQGARSVWLLSGAMALAVCVGFSASGERGTLAAAIFLLGMQVALTGFNFAFWAMLPDTTDYGELHTGLRVDAIAFGAAALLQKLALGVAAVVIGVIYQAIGYRQGGIVDPGVQAGITWTMIVGPATFIAVSLPFMAANPLRRTTHIAVLSALEARRSHQAAVSSHRPVTPAASAEGATHS